MNEMRKLMEAVERINEGWDPKAIADAIWLEYTGDPKSLFRLKVEQSPEPFRAMVYNFGSMTGLYNAETLDGSEIWHNIIDELELLSAGPGEDESGWDNSGNVSVRSGEVVEEDEMASQLNIANDDAYSHLVNAAYALAADAVEQAGGVYDEEGDGEEGSRFHTGAQNRHQYIDIAARKFLSDDYKSDIMSEFSKMFDTAVAKEIQEYNERR